MRVSILVATRSRPSELRRLLESLARLKFRQLDEDRAIAAVVIVDNASPPEGYDSDELSSLCGLDVRVVHESRTGIPFARNTAIRNRNREADAVVFIDDDVTATPSWLEQLIIAAEQHDADFVSGPSLPRIPPGASPRARAILSTLRSARPADGTVLEHAATGNLLINTSWLDRQETWLDESFGTAGGSDIEWTARSVEQGARLIHADRAVTWHWLSEERASLRWLVQRGYRVGFGQAERARDAGTKRSHLVRSTFKELGRVVLVWIRAVLGRDSELRYAAEHRVPWISGWLACAVGLPRPKVYRKVTSDNSGM
ncbi:MAG: glycosyltransferase [Acidimicrobiales bacterium]